MLNLVTGATGLVGSNLVEALRVRGEDVRILARPGSRTRHLREIGIDIRVGNLSDNSTIMAAAEGTDRIFHCASLVGDWGVWENYYQTNVQGTRNMLAAATRAHVSKFIYLSTTDIYGFPGHPVDESTAPSPRGFPFGDSKIQAETAIWTHRRRVGLPVSVIRAGTIYGPGAGLVVTQFVQDLRRRRLFFIDEGEHVVGLVYVGNLVDALILAADSEDSAGQAYNILDGNQVTWREYIHTLADMAELPRPTRNYSHWRATAMAAFWETYYSIMGRTERPPLTRVMVERMGTDQDFSIEKARNELNYTPRVGFEEGMRHVGRWLRREGLLEMGDFA